MTLTLELNPDVEARLRDRAAREGRDEAAVALSLLDASLVPGTADEGLPAPSGYPADFFERTYGSLADDPLTHNTGEFRRVPGLLPEDWE